MPASGGRSARSAGTVCWSTRRIVLRPGPGGHPFGHRTRTPSPRGWPGAAWSRQQGQTSQPGVSVSVRTEVSERWVRAFVDDVAVVDSRAPVLCWEEEFPVPTYAFAADDVRADLLRPSKAEPPHGPAFFLPKGPVAEWFDLEVGDRLLEHVAWRRDDPAVADLLVLSWQPGLVDRWQEEDEVVRGHPRDPHKRVDALPSSRHVEISLDGVVLADSTSPVLLFETGLPTRFYLPADDVDLGALTATTTTSHCPYKGDADRYWSAAGSADIAWSYSAPFPAVGAIQDRIAFYDELLDVRVDGRLRERPVSPFSSRANRPGREG